jgi:hypothetical protein
MSDTPHTPLLATAHAALERMNRATPTGQALPRPVWLQRQAAQPVTPEQLAAAVAELPAPVQGWWQTSDRTAVATPAATGPSTANALAEWHQLMEAEWTAGPTSLQVRRVGGVLHLARLTEHSQATPQAQAALATDHPLLPRADLAQAMTVTTYAQWSAPQAQVAPFAQRLRALHPLNPADPHTEDAA